MVHGRSTEEDQHGDHLESGRHLLGDRPSDRGSRLVIVLSWSYQGGCQLGMAPSRLAGGDLPYCYKSRQVSAAWHEVETLLFADTDVSPGAFMSDLRERVEEDRGLLKRIQLHVPGFAGYRRREDIRTADKMLRMQMADMLKQVRGTVEETRSTLAENYQIKELDKVGGLISRFQSLEGKVRHAEGGYSGISPAIQVKEHELDRLYEYDVALLDAVADMGREAEELKAAADDGKEVPEKVAKLRSLADDFEETFKKRMLAITGTEVGR